MGPKKGVISIVKIFYPHTKNSKHDQFHTTRRDSRHSGFVSIRKGNSNSTDLWLVKKSRKKPRKKSNWFKGQSAASRRR